MASGSFCLPSLLLRNCSSVVAHWPPRRDARIGKTRQCDTGCGDSVLSVTSAQSIPEMKEGAAASCALRNCLSSGDQAATTLCLALPWTGLEPLGLSDGASNSVSATDLVDVDIMLLSRSAFYPP